jgi:hypothetical protein
MTAFEIGIGKYGEGIRMEDRGQLGKTTHPKHTQ